MKILERTVTEIRHGRLTVDVLDIDDFESSDVYFKVYFGFNDTAWFAISTNVPDILVASKSYAQKISLIELKDRIYKGTISNQVML